MTGGIRSLSSGDILVQVLKAPQILDEVRRDQLALTLLWNDMEAKKWKDVEELLPELKDESATRLAIQNELQSAIRRELKKREIP